MLCIGFVCDVNKCLEPFFRSSRLEHSNTRCFLMHSLIFEGRSQSCNATRASSFSLHQSQQSIGHTMGLMLNFVPLNAGSWWRMGELTSVMQCSCTVIIVWHMPCDCKAARKEATITRTLVSCPNRVHCSKASHNLSRLSCLN